MNLFNYRRRLSHIITIGGTPMGGYHPVRVQSMCNTSTMATDASVAQTLRIAEAGGDYVRLTTQGIREAENMRNINAGVRAAGCNVPLVADVHFNPRVADVAALYCEKVRVNPGNYAPTLADIEAKFVPFLALCREHGTAVRIGVNHGSLSPRVVEQYGDTPEGIVESCMEFLRICQREEFANVVVSIKASNTVVMVQSVRLLTVRMTEEGMSFPLHLGVTEAGEGEDGRIKSAVGIGALLMDGIGDTIRVSLSEAPEKEIPVARDIVSYVTSCRQGADLPIPTDAQLPSWYNWLRPSKRRPGSVPEVYTELPQGSVVLNPFVLNASIAEQLKASPDTIIVSKPRTANRLGEHRALVFALGNLGIENPVVAYHEDTHPVHAAIELGTLFIDGLMDGIVTPDEQLGYSILQAARARFTKTEYISCPGCGRTLYDLEGTIASIKAATAHLTGTKIAIMGCIVNGPGEMADADYGYVGAGPGKISLYRGKECVERNIPESEAVGNLLALIEKDKND